MIKRHKDAGRRRAAAMNEAEPAARSAGVQMKGAGLVQQQAALAPGAQGYALQQKALTPEGEHKTRGRRASRPEDGSYVVQGNWDSFSEWYLTFQGRQLVDSHTDDLPAADWPTQMTRKGGELVLTQTTEASDATITEELVVEFVKVQGSGRTLRAKRATTTFVDHTSDGNVSTRTQTDLPVVAG